MDCLVGSSGGAKAWTNCGFPRSGLGNAALDQWQRRMRETDRGCESMSPAQSAALTSTSPVCCPAPSILLLRVFGTRTRPEPPPASGTRRASGGVEPSRGSAQGYRPQRRRPGRSGSQGLLELGHPVMRRQWEERVTPEKLDSPRDLGGASPRD